MNPMCEACPGYTGHDIGCDCEVCPGEHAYGTLACMGAVL